MESIVQSPNDAPSPSQIQVDLFNMPQAAKGFVLERFRTGNQIVDLVLGSIIFIILMQITNISAQTDLFSLITSAVHRFYEYLFNYRNKGEIEFLIEQIDEVSNCFTPTYRAIMYKLGTIKSDQVWRFKEKRLEWYDNSEYKNVKECLYQVLQTEPIKVEDDVWVRCEEKSEDRTNNGNQLVNVMTYKVCVYSKTKTVHYLKKVVEGWLKEYKNHKKNQLLGKQLIFLVRFPEKGLDKRDSDPNEDIQYSTFKTFRSFNNLFFEQKDEVLNDINFFLNEKEWHKKRGIPDSLGILCYGVPGCGKTSFIKALLRKTNRHGVIFSVNRHTRLESIEKLMRNETLCDFPIPQDQRIYILEDIDAMGDLVTKRHNPLDEKNEKDEKLDEEAENERLTREKEEEIFERQLFKWLKFGITKSSDHHLGFFLNLLDGLVETPGRIIVMTTNHIENLDPALIRPGRIDIKIEFVKCSRHIAKQIISHFYNKAMDDWELSEEILEGQITPAELTQICRAHKFDFDGAVQELDRWMITQKRQLEKSENTTDGSSNLTLSTKLNLVDSPTRHRNRSPTPSVSLTSEPDTAENETCSFSDESPM